MQEEQKIAQLEKSIKKGQIAQPYARRRNSQLYMHQEETMQ